MLLTRSRLCPGPKPGSSLHLHVLGTPPAFVLSQDQTLREELPQRVVRNARSAECDRKLCRGRTGSESWVCPWWDQTLAPTVRRHEAGTEPPTHRQSRRGRSPMYTKGSGAQDGVNSGTAVRAAPRRERPSGGVEPGHTSRPRDGRRVCMLLSFQRPSHLFWKGIFLRGAPGSLDRSRGGPTSIALGGDVIAGMTESRRALPRDQISIERGRRPCVLAGGRRSR